MGYVFSFLTSNSLVSEINLMNILMHFVFNSQLGLVYPYIFLWNDGAPNWDRFQMVVNGLFPFLHWGICGIGV